jgi:hypothetical protein
MQCSKLLSEIVYGVIMRWLDHGIFHIGPSIHHVSPVPSGRAGLSGLPADGLIGTLEMR